MPPRPHSPRHPPEARMRLLGPALAGAGLIGLVLVFFGNSTHDEKPHVDPPVEQTSGAAPLEILEPLGMVPSWYLFRWLGEPPHDGAFRVRVWNGDWPDSAPVVERFTDEPFWMPNEMERVEFPGRMIWEVCSLDAQGREVEATEGRARLETSELDAESEPPLSPDTAGTEAPNADPWFELSLRSEASVGDAALQQMRSAFGDYLEAWGRTQDHPYESGFLRHTKRRAALNTLVHLEATRVEDVQARDQALEHLYRAQATDLILPPPELSVARELLTANDTLVLAYVPGRQRISVLAFDAHRSFYATLPLQREYERTRRKLQEALTLPDAERDEEEVVTAIRTLSRFLLPADLGSHLEGIRHLTLAGSDLLGYVPFELLTLPTGERLEERCALHYLDSLPHGAHILSQPRKEASWSRELGLLFAVPLDDERRARWPELEPIPHARENRALLRSHLRPGQIEMFEGRSATRFALARSARNARTLHLLVHAVQPEDERAPGLLLAKTHGDEDIVGLAELAEIDFPPLVRVSIAGASAGAWDGTRAALVSSLLLERGADVVLMTPCSLAPTTIESMTPLLHRGLFTEGLSVAQAVRHARAAWLAEGGSPYAGLVHVYGAGSAPLH